MENTEIDQRETNSRQRPRLGERDQAIDREHAEED